MMINFILQFIIGFALSWPLFCLMQVYKYRKQIQEIADAQKYPSDKLMWEAHLGKMSFWRHFWLMFTFRKVNY